MAYIVDRRWDGPIPYKIGRRVRDNAALYQNVLEAIRRIDAVPGVVMKYRKSQRDYILFQFWRGHSGNEGESSDTGNEPRILGFGGGRQEISLGARADVPVIMHEICHAIGMHHEHRRPDRGSHVKVLWSRIDPDKKDQYKKKSWGVRLGPYDIKSIMHYNGNEFGMYNWSHGWTNLMFHAIDKTVLLLLLKRDYGNIHVHHMNGAVVGNRIQNKNWTEGYSSMCPFAVRGDNAEQHYVLFLKSKNGVLKIHRLTEAGIGENVQSRTWSGGWVHAKTWQVPNSTYLIIQNTSGLTRTHLMKSDGTVGELRYESRAASLRGSSLEPFYVTQSDGRRKWYLFSLNQLSGSVRVHGLNEDGTIGAPVDERRWSEGWTKAKHYEYEGVTYLFLLKADSGLIHLHEMNRDGSVGPRTDRRNWTSAYSNLGIHVPSGRRPYSFVLKTSNGHGHIHYLGKGVISSHVSPPTMVSKKGVAMGGNDLTPGDKAALDWLNN